MSGKSSTSKTHIHFERQTGYTPCQPYVSVIEKTSTGYCGFFPDLAGCVAAGETYSEVLKLLAEALALHLYLMVRGGERIPSPSLPLMGAEDGNTQTVMVAPAEMNPVSLAVGDMIEESGLSLRGFAKEYHISYGVVSRIKDPFYWGHTMETLRSFGEKFGVKPVVNFVRIFGHAAD